MTDDDLDPAACRRLWVAVASAVIEDARRGRDVDFLRSDDFAHVAALAGLDPDAARQAAWRRLGANA